MNKTINNIEKSKLILIAAGVVAVIFVICWLVRGVQKTEVSLEADQTIDVTPQQIESIRAIGQWEFLSISNEELVDTTRKGIFRDDHLARIYYGTVRLGVDMQKMDSTWITVQGDSITLWLPRPTLLDKNFIDEARTKSFHESGRWKPEAREALYKKAYQKMLRHCVTPENIRSAQQNGDAQFRHMMKTMGYEHIKIQWTK